VRNFHITADIAAPPNRVFEVMSDVDRWHEWTPSVTERYLDMEAAGLKARSENPSFVPDGSRR
jgi:uncharacterized protein YndB with AHSA1/START domain